MPVDRELAYESLKWIDPTVYRAYLRLKYREITDEEFQRDSVSFYKLRIIVHPMQKSCLKLALTLLVFGAGGGI